MWPRLAKALVVTGILISTASAADTSPSLTFEDCLNAALSRNEDLGEQRELVFQADQRSRQAKGSIFPTIEAVASHLWQDSAETGIGRSIAPRTQPLLRISATQPLFRGLREFAALRQSRHLTDAQRYELRNAERLLHASLARSFYTILSLESQISNFEHEISLIRRRIQELKNRKRIGRSRSSEVLNVETSLATTQAELERIRSLLQPERENLSFLTGLSPLVSIHDPLLKQINADSPLPELAVYLQKMEERFDIKADAERRNAASESVRIARGAHFPEIDLSANYYLERSGALEAAKWDVQIELTLPIYSGGVTQSRVREAGSVLSQSEYSLAGTRRRAHQEITSLHQEWGLTRTRLKTLTEALTLAERNYAEQTREYRLGLVTNLEVLQALTTRAEITRSVDQTRIELKLLLERLKAAAII